MKPLFHSELKVSEPHPLPYFEMDLIHYKTLSRMAARGHWYEMFNHAFGDQIVVTGQGLFRPVIFAVQRNGKTKRT